MGTIMFYALRELCDRLYSYMSIPVMCIASFNLFLLAGLLLYRSITVLV